MTTDNQAKPHTRKLGHGYEKGNFERETESLSIAAQNNTIRTTSKQE